MLLLRLVNQSILQKTFLNHFIPTFVLGLFFSIHVNAVLVEKVLAVVNDSIITMTDIELYKKSLKSGELLEEVLTQDEVKKLLNDKDALLSNLIDKKIIDQEVKKKGFNLSDSQLEKEVRNIYKSHNMTKDELKKALEVKGFSFEEYLAFMGSNIARQNLISQEIASKIKITDSDIANYYYSKNNNAPSSIYQYTVSQLHWDRRKTKEASDALLALKTGKVSFEEMIKKTGGISGKLGTFKPNDFSKAFSVVLNLKPGEFSDVIKSEAGLHILRLDEKELISNPQIEEMKVQLTMELQNKLLQDRLKSWLKEKRSQAFIRINK